jgi:hypothetical protein
VFEGTRSAGLVQLASGSSRIDVRESRESSCRRGSSFLTHDPPSTDWDRTSPPDLPPCRHGAIGPQLHPSFIEVFSGAAVGDCHRPLAGAGEDAFGPTGALPVMSGNGRSSGMCGRADEATTHTGSFRVGDASFRERPRRGVGSGGGCVERDVVSSAGTYPQLGDLARYNPATLEYGKSSP